MDFVPRAIPPCRGKNTKTRLQCNNNSVTLLAAKTRGDYGLGEHGRSGISIRYSFRVLDAGDSAKIWPSIMQVAHAFREAQRCIKRRKKLCRELGQPRNAKRNSSAKLELRESSTLYLLSQVAG